LRARLAAHARPESARARPARVRGARGVRARHRPFRRLARRIPRPAPLTRRGDTAMTDLEFVELMNSTIVRSHRPAALPLLRAGARTLSALAPERAAQLAERLFLTPPPPRRPTAEVALLERAHARPLFAGGRRLAMGKGGRGPAVLLAHGWGGRGTQLGAFVDPLVTRGFSVVAFDAPGHGVAEPGLVTIPEMTAALRAVADT